jgi:hypothetical protein
MLRFNIFQLGPEVGPTGSDPVRTGSDPLGLAYGQNFCLETIFIIVVTVTQLRRGVFAGHGFEKTNRDG